MTLPLRERCATMKAALGNDAQLSSSAGTPGATVATLDEAHQHRHPVVEALMADPRDTAADVAAISTPASLVTLGPDWETEDAYWQSAYPERPYARADRSYEYYRAAYRFGAERAARWRGREWSEVERDLRRDWSASDEGSAAMWEEMKDAVRDAWDHVHGRSDDDRTHIR
jgi:hypothetical protein